MDMDLIDKSLLCAAWYGQVGVLRSIRGFYGFHEAHHGLTIRNQQRKAVWGWHEGDSYVD